MFLFLFLFLFFSFFFFRFSAFLLFVLHSGRVPSPSGVELGRRVAFVGFAVVHVNHDQRDEKKQERRGPRELPTKEEKATPVRNHSHQADRESNKTEKTKAK